MPGGGERYAASLATHLRGRGHQVEVVTSRAIRERDLWDGTTGADQTDREILRRIWLSAYRYSRFQWVAPG
ncbi:MAG: glycosyltransferase [Chloroflexota bacterium]